jgi:glycosyltransferase involved in cell wall biosynthesis
MTRVDIVIPTYNHARFLGEALRSVIGQTMESWRAIIVNNFSTDDTHDVVASFADPRIGIVDFANHGIIAASRNHGLSLATAPYVAFLDSDDSWYPDKLARCVAALDTGADIVCHGERWTSTDGTHRDVAYGPERNARYERLLYRHNCVSTSAVVARRDLLADVGGFDERPDFVTAEDYDLWLRLARQGARYVFIPEILGEFRRHEASASSAVERNAAAELAVVNSHISALPTSFSVRIRHRHRRARVAYAAARSHQERAHRRDALRRYCECIRTSPFVIRAWIGLVLLLAPTRLARR